MPEGPDVLYNSLMLNHQLKNCKITNIESGGKKNITMPTTFDGKIIKVDCKGKLLWFETADNNFVHVHFGMKGVFEFNEPENKNTISYIFTIMCDDRTLKHNGVNNDNNNNNVDSKNLINNDNNNNNVDSKYLINEPLPTTNNFKMFLKDSDYRKLAKVVILNKQEHEIIINDLGISIFNPDFTLNNFKAIIKSSKTILSSFLMNPHNISGIGNYINNEIFYLTELLPVKIKTNQLTDSQINKLYNNILFVSYSVLMTHLRQHNDLKKVGITLTNPIFANLPNNIEVPYEYKIYKRKIAKNGETVTEIKVNGRNTYCVEEQCEKLK